MARGNRSHKAPIDFSSETLFRYQVVSAAKAKLMLGKDRAQTVKEVAQSQFLAADGELRSVSVRSIYRWLSKFETQGPSALETVDVAQGPISKALSPALIDFLRAEKKLDRYATVPEIIRRARLRGVLGPTERCDRTSVWRACLRMDLPLRRAPSKHEADKRRWRYPHRMQLILADGKHFRAGPQRTRRVALFFLDDATRFGLDVVVGTSECAELFLRGLYIVVRGFGFFDIVFLDKGPGFIAHDTVAACRRLECHLVHGRDQYPEGHGAVERFNQTAGQQCLRGLPGAVDVDDDCGALELRLRHFLTQQYNQQPHEALDGQTPQARWDADSRPLRFPKDEDDLRDRFLVSEMRRVSADNVISYESVDYEIPRGHAGTHIQLWRRLLTGQLLVVHDGRLVALLPVDLAQNAIDRRARFEAPPPGDDEGTPTTAAQLAFTRDFGPAVAPDGGYLPPQPKDDDHHD